MAELSPSLLTPLYKLDGYRRYFTDASFWEPFIALVCRRHALPITGAPRSGLPGTFPTFIVSDRWVVKFFGPLFEGPACFQVELACSRLLPPGFPVPALVTSGNLYPPGTTEHFWPYLVSEYIPAPSIGEVYPRISSSSKLALAHQLGFLLHLMHRIPLAAEPVFTPGWQPYQQLLARQISGCLERHTAWGSLPASMLYEIPAYLLSASELIPPAQAPSLIHADLTRDHLLGHLSPDGNWRLRAIIDFGDALSGDLFYELVVLHLELFDANLHLLRTYLEAYQLSPFHQQDFVRKAMNLTLLHAYDPFATLFERHPEMRQCTSLEELANRLWDGCSLE